MSPLRGWCMICPITYGARRGSQQPLIAPDYFRARPRGRADARLYTAACASDSIVFVNVASSLTFRLVLERSI